MRRETVHIVSRCVDSKWPEDREIEVVKVFKGSRKLATISRYMVKQRKANVGYLYWVDTHEVE